MFIEKVSPIRRGNLQDVAKFLNLPKTHSNSTRHERVASSHLLVKELLKIPELQCQSSIVDDDFGYSEDYFFYEINKEHLIIRLSIKCCDQWQTYNRSIYKPSTMFDYNILVEKCTENMSKKYRENILNVVSGMMKIARQDYVFYVDGDEKDFIFCIEHNRKFSKLSLEVQSL